MEAVELEMDGERVRIELEQDGLVKVTPEHKDILMTPAEAIDLAGAILIMARLGLDE